MRRYLILLALVVAACSSGQELAPTTAPSTAPPTTATPSTAPPTTDGDTPTTTAGPTTTTTTLPPLQSLAYEEVTRIDFPIHLVPRNGNESVLATKAGQLFMYSDGQVGDAPFLDLSARVRDSGERGLLGIAVHPDDDSRLFVHYSANDGDTVVEEYAFGESDATQQLLRLDQPASNHNGGMIQFGPDGALYLGLGDGGGSNDRFGHGQNTNSLFGGIVRIDVDDPDPELFHYGLRNPWRFWIDGETIHVADVGQNQYEEVTVAPLVPDVNHGWPITEGLHCFSPSSGCDTTGITLPVIEVSHSDSNTCSITGGVVYRGSAIPEVQGHYFYSDYCGGYLRSFTQTGGSLEEIDWTDQVGVNGLTPSFGTDHEGEMYVLTIDAVFKVVANR